MTDKLNLYLTLWRLSNPHLLAETATSHVYTVQADGETAVLKILSDYGIEERRGAAALRHFDSCGAVRLLRHDDGAHLLEYAEGGDLIPLVRRGEDEKATEIIAGVLNQLHRAPAELMPDGVFPLKLWFRALYDKAKAEQNHGTESIFVRGARLADQLFAQPHESYVLHGDIHHENIRFKPGRGWLAIDPKGVWGDRAYDTANTFYNPFNMPILTENEARMVRTASILAERTGIDRARLLAYVFVYGCLSAAWSLEADSDISSTLRTAAIAEKHI